MDSVKRAFRSGIKLHGQLSEDGPGRVLLTADLKRLDTNMFMVPVTKIEIDVTVSDYETDVVRFSDTFSADRSGSRPGGLGIQRLRLRDQGLHRARPDRSGERGRQATNAFCKRFAEAPPPAFAEASRTALIAGPAWRQRRISRSAGSRRASPRRPRRSPVGSSGALHIMRWISWASAGGLSRRCRARGPGPGPRGVGPRHRLRGRAGVPSTARRA